MNSPAAFLPRLSILTYLLLSKRRNPCPRRWLTLSDVRSPGVRQGPLMELVLHIQNNSLVVLNLSSPLP
jgi:hypothetical protein